MERRTRILATVAFVAAFAGAVAATVTLRGSGARKANEKPLVVQTGTQNAASLGSFDPATRKVVVHAKDFAFDAPDSISAGWTSFHLVNDGPMIHHVQIVRLDSGKTAQDFGAAMKNPGPPPRWVVFMGGPNAPSPGATSDASLELQPGSYLYICLVDIGDHIPHFAKGMVRPFTVTAPTGNTGVAPVADVTVSLADYSFVVKGPLSTAGAHTIRVDNTGPQPHEMEIVRIAPGKTLEEFAAWIDKPVGPPPGDAIGGIVAQMAGAGNQYFMTSFTAGHYALVCFIPDGKDGKPHIAHGMVKEFTVN